MNEDLIYCAPLWLRKRFAVTVPKFAARKWNGRNLEMVSAAVAQGRKYQRATSLFLAFSSARSQYTLVARVSVCLCVGG